MYKIDTEGSVWSMNYRNLGRIEKLKPKRLQTGYLYVDLHKDKKIKRFLVHRLVASHFIGEIEGKVIDHLNCKPDDNRVENLRICSTKENNNNPLTRIKNSKAKSKSITLRGVKDCSVFHFNSGVEASKHFNYKSRRAVWQLIKEAKEKGSKTISLGGDEFYYKVGNNNL